MEARSSLRSTSRPCLAAAPWQDILVRLADRLIVFGPTVAARASQRWPDCEGKMRIVPHGNYDHVVHRYERAYARRCLGLPAALPVFAFIGQLRPEKGSTRSSKRSPNTERPPSDGYDRGNRHRPAYLKQIQSRVSAAAGRPVGYRRTMCHNAASILSRPPHLISCSLLYRDAEWECHLRDDAWSMRHLNYDWRGAGVAGGHGRGVVVGPEDSTNLWTCPRGAGCRRTANGRRAERQRGPTRSLSWDGRGLQL